ncbi:MAG: FAD-dependent oxidoreductase [Pleurocapsa sp. CRU_1_2]|nr:FAD-dependent oxidoreductase [Pleurocapsa sp. CRU_1_2]
MFMNQKLVLIGGGHSHAIALRQWGLNPLPDVDLTLISDVEQTPYSGMLPGHVAGFYSYDETHIDLRSLAKFAGAEFVGDRAIGIDLESNQVICASGQLKFDYLSLDIGSIPQTLTVPGAKEYVIPAKPVPGFLDAWYKLKQSAAAHPEQPLSIAIVGGGAGGVELALNMQSCLKEIFKDKHILEIHLIHRGKQLLSGHNDWVSKKLTKIIQQRGIKLHLQQDVTKVLADRVICQSGLEIESNHIFWVTQAAAPSWINESQLKTDNQGFILVSDTLQSISHPHIFAAGDIATMVNHQRPKAGVFAVRQGQPLFNNWQNILTQQPPQSYIPQDKYLALIGTGDHKAIASWDFLGWRSAFFWWLKDYIDRKFMNQFINL